jgi:multiple sugar transport system substrate-binding protein
MKVKKCFVFVSLLVVAMLLLAGCAKPTEAPEEPVPVEKPEEAAPPEEPAVEEEVVEIVYMRQAEGVQAELDLVEEFNASQDRIHVTVDSNPAEDNYPKLVLTTEAGNPPDVYMTYWTLGAATNGLALDLTELIEREGEEWFNSLAENGWLFHFYAGSYYAVPWRLAPTLVFINNALLEKNGLEPPPMDWTWDDFVAYAQAMTNPDEGEYGVCVMAGAECTGTDYQFYPILFEAGGKMINEEGLAGFNTPEGASALQFLVDLVLEHKVTEPGVTSANQNTCIDLLAADKMGMHFDASLWRGWIRALYPGADFTVAPMPMGVSTGSLIGGTGFGISPDSKHIDEAWEFIKFMVSEGSMRKWTAAVDFTPPNVSLLTNEEWLAEDPEREVVAWVMLNQVMYPLAHYPDNFNLESILRNYMQAAYLQEMTAEEALAAAELEWNEILVEYQAEEWWDAWLK